jgi:hypothetical protein
MWSLFMSYDVFHSKQLELYTISPIALKDHGKDTYCIRLMARIFQFRTFSACWCTMSKLEGGSTTRPVRARYDWASTQVVTAGILTSNSGLQLYQGFLYKLLFCWIWRKKSSLQAVGINFKMSS